ncbi:MAG: glycosyltransferase family 4 protein [Chloroflexi bacterium]|nr:glycosyltransferase family 4 protein [Chloroflexota bacterium]
MPDLNDVGKLPRRIGIDATCWQNNRGYGRHARALLRALARIAPENHYTFLMDAQENLDKLPPRVQVELVRASAPTALAASAQGHRSLGDMWRMSRALSAPNFDLVLFPTIYSFVPVVSRAKKIVMIHDVIADKFPELTLPSRTARLFWDIKVALGRWQADALVTVSEYSRQAIIEHFAIAPERVAVVGEAGDPVFRVLDDPQFTARLTALGIAPDQSLVVYVGGFAPHKNLQTLVAAFAQIAMRAEFANARLVMVGENQNEVFHSYFSTIKNQVDALGIADRVIFTGYLPDDELVVLLNRATVLALPSLMEGFGLPALEAAACGCPVTATTASPLPDLLGAGGLYIAPSDAPGWHDALARVLQSRELRAQMRVAGLAAAQRLTWDAAAQQLRAIINRTSP